MHTAFDPLRDLFISGEAIKRRAIIDLFNKTMSGEKKYFLRWNHTVKTIISILKCRKTIEFFDTAHNLLL